MRFSAVYSFKNEAAVLSCHPTVNLPIASTPDLCLLRHSLSVGLFFVIVEHYDQ